MANDDDKSENEVPAVGAGVALGAGIGAVLFALTDSPVWIGVGAAVGAGIGVAIGAAQDKQDDE